MREDYFYSKLQRRIILLGVSLAAFGVGLFFLRSLYPKLARDYDAVLALYFAYVEY